MTCDPPQEDDEESLRIHYTFQKCGEEFQITHNLSMVTHDPPQADDDTLTVGYVEFEKCHVEFQRRYVEFEKCDEEFQKGDDTLIRVQMEFASMLRKLPFLIEKREMGQIYEYVRLRRIQIYEWEF